MNLLQEHATNDQRAARIAQPDLYSSENESSVITKFATYFDNVYLLRGRVSLAAWNVVMINVRLTHSK